LSLRQRLAVGWRLLRPFTLIASIIPALIGTGLAIADGFFRPGLFGAFLVASILIQAATNIFNEYFDYKRGLDTDAMVGISGTILRDGVAPRTVLALGWTLVAAAVAVGLIISAFSSWWVFAAGIGCIMVAYLYSGGPIPLAYTPFGELAAGMTMGPVLILIAYFIQTGQLALSALAASVPIGLLISAILLANNIRDRDLDLAGGRRTIAVLVGRAWARLIFGALFAAAYLIVFVLIWRDMITPWAGLVAFTIPTALRNTRLFFQFTEPARLHAGVKGTAGLLMAFGLLLFAAIIFGTVHRTL